MSAIFALNPAASQCLVRDKRVGLIVESRFVLLRLLENDVFSWTYIAYDGLKSTIDDSVFCTITEVRSGPSILPTPHGFSWSTSSLDRTVQQDGITFLVHGEVPPPQDLNLLDVEDLRVLCKLGEGAFGTVHLAQDFAASTSTSTAPSFVAVKTAKSKAAERELIAEIKYHEMVAGHPNLVSFRRSFRSMDDQGIELLHSVMEYVPGEDLHYQIHSAMRNVYIGNSHLIKDAALSLIDAVLHMHNKGVSSSSSATSNPPTYSSRTEDLPSTSSFVPCESVYFYRRNLNSATPIRPARTYSLEKHDVWSLGVVLFLMVFGEQPWEEAGKEDLFFEDFVEKPMEYFHTNWPVSKEFEKLLMGIFHPNSDKRIGVEGLREGVANLKDFYASKDEVVPGSEADQVAGDLGLWDSRSSCPGSSTSSSSPSLSTPKDSLFDEDVDVDVEMEEDGDVDSPSTVIDIARNVVWEERCPMEVQEDEQEQQRALNRQRYAALYC